MGFGDKNFTYGPKIIKDGLVLYVDAQNPKSVISGDTNMYSIVPQKGDLEKYNLLNDTYVAQVGNKKVLRFDGTDDYVQAIGSPIQELTPNMTFCTWVSHNRSPLNPQGSIIFFNGSGASVERCFFRVAGNTISIQITNGVSSNTTSVSTYTSVNYPNDFNNVCVTIEENVGSGTTNTKFYINGDLVSEDNSMTIVNGRNSSLDNRNEPDIGRSGSTGSWRFDGDIALVKVYDKALSTEKIKRNYNALKSRFGL